MEGKKEKKEDVEILFHHIPNSELPFTDEAPVEINGAHGERGRGFIFANKAKKNSKKIKPIIIKVVDQLYEDGVLSVYMEIPGELRHKGFV